MKWKMNFAQITRTVLWLGLIVCAGFTAARAQLPDGTLIPRVCFEAKPETFTRTLTTSVSAGQSEVINLNQAVPDGFYRVFFVGNPDGTTQETSILRRTISSVGNSLSFNNTGVTSQPLLYAHAAGETVLVISEGEAVFGYRNTSNTTLAIPRGVSSHNFFAPGTLTYSAQPATFQPGVKASAFRLKTSSPANFSWFLNGGQATSMASAAQGCGIITYQGRLSDAGSAANGQFDLQFQAFDTLTDGIAQGELIALEDVQVSGGIFTVSLFFGSTLNNNYNLRFLQIGVRPGTSTGAFTTLAPRQPITQVPFAINAQNAATATTATTVVGATNLNTANTIVQRDAAGNFTAGAITATTFNGNLNGTATNATNATSATNATNSEQLGGVPAADYLTNTSNFGQSVTTSLGGTLAIDASVSGYTLVPGLTQTINFPANSSLLISTEGGIQSSGTVGSASMIDAAIFIDGTLLKASRITIYNNPFPLSVGNWALSFGQTPTAGSHTIEVRVRNGGIGGTANATVGSNSDPLLRGQLTIAVIRK